MSIMKLSNLVRYLIAFVSLSFLFTLSHAGMSVKLDENCAESLGQKALVITLQHYETPLKTSVNDGEAISAVFKEMGYEVTRHKKIGRSEVNSTIRSFSNNLKRCQSVVLYFSGKGFSFSQEDWLFVSPTERDLDLSAVGVSALNLNSIIGDIRRRSPYQIITFWDVPRYRITEKVEKYSMVPAKPSVSEAVFFASEIDSLSTEQLAISDQYSPFNKVLVGLLSSEPSLMIRDIHPKLTFGLNQMTCSDGRDICQRPGFKNNLDYTITTAYYLNNF